MNDKRRAALLLMQARIQKALDTNQDVDFPGGYPEPAEPTDTVESLKERLNHEHWLRTCAEDLSSTIADQRDANAETISQLEAQLVEARGNDRTAMGYLSQVREIVGGDDFPSMVQRVAELKRTSKTLTKAAVSKADHAAGELGYCEFLQPVAFDAVLYTVSE